MKGKGDTTYDGRRKQGNVGPEHSLRQKEQRRGVNAGDSVRTGAASTGSDKV